VIRLLGRRPDQELQGSDLAAGGNILLDAQGDTLLAAQQNTASQKTYGISSNASIGVGLSVGGTQNGVSIKQAPGAWRQAAARTRAMAGGAAGLETSQNWGQFAIPAVGPAAAKCATTPNCQRAVTYVSNKTVYVAQSVMNLATKILGENNVMKFWRRWVMVWPILKILIPEVLEQAFPVVVELLGECGLKVENAYNYKITTWSDSGDQENIPLGNFLSEVLDGNINNIQFWSAPEDDVFVSWKEGPRGCVFSIYLNGVDHVLAAAIVSKFAEEAIAKYKLKYGIGEALSIIFE
jgi:hypothetical protein